MIRADSNVNAQDITMQKIILFMESSAGWLDHVILVGYLSLPILLWTPHFKKRKWTFLF